MSDGQLLVVKKESPVEDAKSKLYKWDSAVRKYHANFEVKKAALWQGIGLLYKNPLTSFRDPIQFGGRYSEMQSLKLRQQLGDISASEVQDAGSALFNGTHLITSMAGSAGSPS